MTAHPRETLDRTITDRLDRADWFHALVQSGVNLHPDTRGIDYIDADGAPTFRGDEARRFEVLMDAACAIDAGLSEEDLGPFGVYAVAMAALTGDLLPLCPGCVARIGGACAGPDMECRQALQGEACEAADCRDGHDDADHDHAMVRPSREEYIARLLGADEEAPCDDCTEPVAYGDSLGSPGDETTDAQHLCADCYANREDDRA